MLYGLLLSAGFQRGSNDCTGDTRILGSLQIGEAESTSEPCSGEDYKEARGNKDESMSGKSVKKVSPSRQNARKEAHELVHRTTKERLRENKVTKWTSQTGKASGRILYVRIKQQGGFC